MPKFSIIIPTRNVEKYIKKCLDSVLNQTFKDFEIIVVDDGSTDNTKNIIKKYKQVKLIEEKTIGVSEARNIAIKEAKGEYLAFLDSDDWWDEQLLEKLNESSKNDPDVIRYQLRTVTDKGVKTDYNEKSFENKNGVEAFELLTKYHFVDAACCNAIKRKYFQKEKYKFAKGRVHEDFGLMPLLIIKAKKVNCISYVGYNYYRRSESIMNNPDYEWTKRKVEDCYFHYKNLIKEISKLNLDDKIFRSFVANNIVSKICSLKKKEYKEYKKKLKQDKVFDNILSDTLPRKIKKIILKISPKLYYKVMK